MVVILAACSGQGRGAAPATTSTPAPASSMTAAPATTSTSVSALTEGATSAALMAAIDPLWAGSPGGCITVVEEGVVVYERGGGTPAAPASTIKLATAAGALAALGADARLRTIVAATAGPSAGVVTGDLWLVGGGDPVLGTDAWAATILDAGEPRTSLDGLADSVVAAGVRRVEGSVVGDESRFDSERYVPTWPARLVADGEVGPMSALTVNDGFRVWGHPGMPFADPPAEAAGIFAGLLRDRGVVVVGEPASGAAPAGVMALTGTASPPVGDLVAAMLRDSDNGTAEALVKEIGLLRRGSGTTAAGVAAIADELEQRGVPAAGNLMADGSGLSELDRVSCRFLAAVLATTESGFAGRLAVAGVSGTLRNRLRGTPAEGAIRAKTGSFDGVSALAGYADHEGATRVFAVLVNGLRPGDTARSLLDGVALALVSA